MVGLEETLDGSEKVNGVIWSGHVLRGDDDGVLIPLILKRVARESHPGFLLLSLLKNI